MDSEAASQARDKEKEKLDLERSGVGAIKFDEIPTATVLQIISKDKGTISTPRGMVSSDTATLLAPVEQVAAPISPQELKVVIRKIRMHAHIMFAFGVLASLSPGTTFAPPLDLILIIANYILILTATGDSAKDKIFDVKEQKGCCGIRHVNGMSIACAAFLIVCSIGKYVTTVFFWMAPNISSFYNLQNNTYQSWKSNMEAEIALQVIASICTGITLYSLIYIASLTAPSRYDQCMTYGHILTDPTKTKADSQIDPASRSRCPVFFSSIIAIGTLIASIFMLVRAGGLTQPAYCAEIKTSFQGFEAYLAGQVRSPPCCKLVSGYNVTCTLVGSNFPTLSNPNNCQCSNPVSETATCSQPDKVGWACYSPNNYGCPSSVTSFLPDQDYTNGFSTTLAFYFAHDNFQVPSCVSSDTCYYGSGTTLRQYSGEQTYASSVSCPQSSYQCTMNAKIPALYCSYLPPYPGFTIP
jgi:hypothetical protein